MYTENEKPTGLTPLTTLVSDDTVIVGDTSDTDEAVKVITYSNLLTQISNDIPGGSGDALTSNPLSQFAATTSAQLRGVLTDETGTGLAVFNDSPTLTTPRFADLGFIADQNGNEMVAFNSNATAVNYLEIENGATTLPPHIRARGDDTNIGLHLVAKGTGEVSVCDAVDETKRLRFGVSNNGTGIITTIRSNSTGTSKTIDLPNTSGTVALTSDLHSAVTVTDSTSIDLTLTGQDITAQREALTGAITAPKNSNATSLGSFTLAQLNTAVSDADVARTDAANTFTGIQTFSTPIAATSLATMTATVGGAVPTPPNNTTTFLRGDGTFAAPSSGFADPLTTNGDIIARVAGATTRLAQGSNGTFLGVSGGALGYYTPPGGDSGITRSITVTSGNVSAGSTASTDYVYIVAGAHTVTLPTAVGNTNLYSIKNNHTADISLATTSSQTVDGVTAPVIRVEQSINVISDGANWTII